MSMHVFLVDIHAICSPAAVDPAGAAAALRPLPQKAAGVSVYQCLL